MKNRLNCFFLSIFFYLRFFGGEQLSPNLKLRSNRPLSTQQRFQKPVGLWGALFEFISLKSEEIRLSLNRDAQSIIIVTGATSAPVIASLVGRTLAHLFFNEF